jgi:hypothetical protein
MKKYWLLAIIAGFSLTASAQGALSAGGPGNFYKPENSEVLGSPFLLPKFVKGVIYLLNGKKEENDLLNIDLYSNKLVYQEDGQTLVVINAVKEFVLKPSDDLTLLFRNGFQAVDKNTAATFYQVLEQGNVSLLKLTRKIIKDKKEFNQAPAKEFDEVDTYYLVKNEGAPVKFRKDRSSVIAAIGDPDGKLEAWLRKTGNKCKQDEELKAVVRAVNENKY